MSSITIPGRASDAGPDPKRDTRDAYELADEAEEAIHRFRQKRGYAVDKDLRIMWLNEAVRLLERAILLEER